MEITRNDSGLAVKKSTIVEYADDQIVNEQIKLDGSESRSNTGFMNSVRISTAKWSTWGDTLNIKYSMTFGQGERAMKIKSTEAWSIAKEGKLLSIQQSSDSPWGKREATVVYERACREY